VVRVSVSELKARLSEHIRRVKGGEEVLVSEQADLDALVETGLVRPAKRLPDEDFWRLQRGRDPNRVVLDALLAERREGR